MSDEELLEGFPLSPQQQQLWSLQTGPAFRSICVCGLDGVLNVSALEAALSDVVDRHEILRTAFRSVPGMSAALQVISGGGGRLRRLPSAPTAEESPAAESLAQELETQPVDLESGTSLDFLLASVSATEHLLAIALPGLCADAVTLDQLMREVAAAYERRLDGGEPDADPLQYADVAQALREILESPEAEASREYWRFQNVRPVSARLPFEEPGGDGEPAPQILAISLDQAAMKSASHLAREHGVSTQALFFACWQLLLRWMTEIPDLPVAATFAGRGYEGLDRALGLFARHLPVPVPVLSGAGFKSLLRQTEESFQAVESHQDGFSWEGLGSPSAEPPALRHWPFCFEWLGSGGAFSTAGVTFSPRLRRARWDRYKLKLTVVGSEGGEAWLEYDTRRLARPVSERIASRFTALLASCLRHPQSPLDGLDLLDEDERRQILYAFNDTQASHPDVETLHRGFERQVDLSPEAVAVLFGGTRLTYGELDRKANRLAHRLRSAGIGPESPVALCMERSLGLIVAILGVLKAGGAYVPLDPEYPAQRREMILRDVGASILLTAESAGYSVDFAATVLEVGVEEDGSWSAERPDIWIDRESPAYVIYTSGSTGRPKGVVISHRAILNRLLWMQRVFPLSPVDRVLQKTPYGFDASVWELFSPLLAGAQMVLAEPGAHRDSALLVELIARHDVTRLQLVPSMLGVFLAEPELSGCSSLRDVFCGGEVLRGEHCRRFFELLDAGLCNLYGPTETAIDASFHICTPADGSGNVSIGRPLDNLRIYLLGPDFRPIAHGMTGALHVGGAGLARGYLNRPELTAERFLPDPFGPEPGGRLYATGDLARYRLDGTLEFLGRSDHQVKIHGIRIELGEIESALGEHPSIGDAVVIAHRDESGGHRLVAYVTPSRRQHPPSLETLGRYLRDRLPEAMVPAVFGVLDFLPRLPNGKVDRGGLPAPESLATAPRRAYVAPESPRQELVAGIWRELLKVEQVGLHDNFFELGGDSILSLQLVSRAHRAGLKITAQHVFSHPTLGGLAEVAVALPVAAASTDETRTPQLLAGPDLQELSSKLGLGGEVEDAYPLSPLQEGLLFHHLYSPGTGTYVGQLSCRIEGEIDEAALAESFQRIVSHHPILRTSYHWEGLERSLQVVRSIVPTQLQREDWVVSGSSVELEQRLKVFLRADRERAFDLTRAPLIRLTLILIDGQPRWMVWSHHHIILDGWSFSMLAADFLTCYEALRSGREPRLAKRAPYRSYIAWLDRQDLSHIEGYWRRTLTGLREPTPLGVDRDLGTAWKGTVARDEWLDPEVSAALQAQARRAQVTLNTLVQGIWGALLGRYSGLQDVAFGVTIAARPAELPGIESIVGLFINTLPLRVDLPWEFPLLTWLRSLHERQADLLRQAHSPLVDVQGWSEIPRSKPLFDSILAFENFPQEEAMDQGSSALPVSEVRATQQTGYPLTVVVVPGEQLRWRISYDVNRFDSATVSRMLGHLRNLLTSLAYIPLEAGARLDGLTLLSDAEAHQVFLGWNDTESSYPEACVHELFAAQASARRDEVAVLCGEAKLTYGEVEERSNRLARHLRRQGVEPGDLVGLCMERSVELVVALLGILKAGAGFAPLDADYPEERLAWMLSDLRVELLLTQRSLAVQLPASAARVLCLDDEWERMAEESVAPLASGALPDSVVYVMYTSGSTGRPKGVMVPHRAVVRLVRETDFAALGPEQVMLQLAPLSFDASTLEIWGALLNGGRLVMMPPQMLSLADLAEALARHEVTTLWLTAGLFHQMVEERLESMSGLQQLLAGGDALSPAHVHRALSALGATRLINGYGPTENTTFTCCYSVRDPEQVGSSVPIGRPISATRVYLLDGQLRAVPVGVAGELYTGGSGLAIGYLGAPELTAERFVPDPFGTTGARLYRTGDLARWQAGGEIEFLGRRDSQVKVRGFRVELGEVEATLAACQGVRAAAVGVREDLPGGKGLVAYVVADLTPAQVREALLRRLPEPMVPTHFVFLDALPLSPNGKLDRRELSRRQLESGEAETYASPQTPTEELLAGLWAEILGWQRVGIHDNFFELGGHSLLAIRLMARIEATQGRKIPLSALFKGPTVAELARHLEAESSSAAWSPLVALQPEGTRPPFFCVHPVGGDVTNYYRHLVHRLGTDQPFYGLQAMGLEAQAGLPCPSIEEMAASYVKAIRQLHPRGPYRLGGASFGGLVAFEMARQLLEEGSEVALLALLDPTAPTRSGAKLRAFPSEAELVFLMANSIAAQEGKVLDMKQEDLEGMEREELLGRVLEAFARMDLVGPELDVPWLSRYLSGFHSRLNAARNYRPEPCRGKVVLLRTVGQDPEAASWKGLASEGIEILETSGSHETMLLEPHVGTLAEILIRLLARTVEEPAARAG
jgi:amino acid adenylation domain-containing protein